MRKLITAISVAALAVSIGTSSASAAASKCATIKDGTIKAATGETITTGTDQYGYNYQAHSFNGTYDGLDRNLDGLYYGGYADYADDKIVMKWSDNWLANVDCNKDGKLDRGLVDGEVGGISLGWTTNHITGDYAGADGEQHDYTIFEKIEYVGAGGSLWGGYEVTQSVVNDSYAGLNGVQSKVSSPGFGNGKTA